MINYDRVLVDFRGNSGAEPETPGRFAITHQFSAGKPLASAMGMNGRPRVSKEKKKWDRHCLPAFRPRVS